MAERMAMNANEMGWKQPLAEPSAATLRHHIP
jgi:hypothetical protein